MLSIIYRLSKISTEPPKIVIESLRDLNQNYKELVDFKVNLFDFKVEMLLLQIHLFKYKCEVKSANKYKSNILT